MVCGCPAGDCEEVEIPFSVEFKGSEVRCGRGVAVGMKRDVNLWLADLKFVVSDPAVRTPKGEWRAVEFVPDGEFQSKKQALLDFEDATGECAKGGTTATQAGVRLRVPKNTSGGMRFTLGGSRDDEARPRALVELGQAGLGGPSFLRLVMKDDLEREVKVELRSTGCGGASSLGGGCERKNHAEVEFERLMLKKEGVVLDIGEFLSRLDSRGHPVLITCGGEADSDQCGAVFAALGLDLVSGKPRGNQVAFRSRYRPF